MQKWLSYAVGMLSALGWQAAMPSVAYAGAQQVLAFISVCNRDFTIEGWHSALFTIAFVLAAIFFNTFAIDKLPVLEGVAIFLHIFGFVAFIVIIWVMGPRVGKSERMTRFRTMMDTPDTATDMCFSHATRCRQNLHNIYRCE